MKPSSLVTFSGPSTFFSFPLSFLWSWRVLPSSLAYFGPLPPPPVPLSSPHPSDPDRRLKDGTGSRFSNFISRISQGRCLVGRSPVCYAPKHEVVSGGLSTTKMGLPLSVSPSRFGKVRRKPTVRVLSGVVSLSTADDPACV